MKFIKMLDKYSIIISDISSVEVSFKFLNIVSTVLGNLLLIKFFNKYFSLEIIDSISLN